MFAASDMYGAAPGSGIGKLQSQAFWMQTVDATTACTCIHTYTYIYIIFSDYNTLRTTDLLLSTQCLEMFSIQLDRIRWF